MQSSVGWCRSSTSDSMSSLPASRQEKSRMLVVFFQAEDGIRGRNVTGVQTCALPILNVDVGGEYRGRLEVVLRVRADGAPGEIGRASCREREHVRLLVAPLTQQQAAAHAARLGPPADHLHGPLAAPARQLSLLLSHLR